MRVETLRKVSRVPKIANVAGLVVMVYFNDHPPPHIHVRAGRPGDPGLEEARFSIESGELIDGRVPAGKVRHVADWCRRNRQALRSDWERAQAGEHPVERYD